jgi:hypothetical protein
MTARLKPPWRVSLQKRLATAAWRRYVLSHHERALFHLLPFFLSVFMETIQAASAGSAPSHTHHLSSTWNRHFCNNETRPRAVESEPLPVDPGECKINTFIWAGEDILSPPCLNWETLELFLKSAALRDLTDRRRSSQLSTLCLIDDRSSGTCQRQDPSNLHVQHGIQSASFRKVLNERELYERLLENVSQYPASENLVSDCVFEESSKERRSEGAVSGCPS